MAPAPWKTWTALGLVYVVWGSTYLAIRYVVDGLPPLLTAATPVRLLAAAGARGLRRWSARAPQRSGRRAAVAQRAPASGCCSCSAATAA